MLTDQERSDFYEKINAAIHRLEVLERRFTAAEKKRKLHENEKEVTNSLPVSTTEMNENPKKRARLSRNSTTNDSCSEATNAFASDVFSKASMQARVQYQPFLTNMELDGNPTEVFPWVDPSSMNSLSFSLGDIQGPSCIVPNRTKGFDESHSSESTEDGYSTASFLNTSEWGTPLSNAILIKPSLSSSSTPASSLFAPVSTDQADHFYTPNVINATF